MRVIRLQKTHVSIVELLGNSDCFTSCPITYISMFLLHPSFHSKSPSPSLQHFYPDGGWGWIVCGVAFLAHVLTTGFQLSYGLLFIYVVQHLRSEETDAIQIGQ